MSLSVDQVREKKRFTNEYWNMLDEANRYLSAKHTKHMDCYGHSNISRPAG